MNSSIYELWLSIKDYVRKHPWLFTIIAIGGFLRLSTIFWGMPVNKYQYNFHPDEWTYLLALYGFPFHTVFQKQLSYPFFVPYSINLLTPFNLFFSTISNIIALIKTGDASEIHYLWISFKFLGRFVSIILGTLSILLAYIAGNKIFGKVAGIASAVFIALSFYAVQNSSFFTPAIPSLFFMLLLIIVGLRLKENPNLQNYLLASIVSAMLMATVYLGGIGVIFILLIHLGIAVKGNKATQPDCHPEQERRISNLSQTDSSSSTQNDKIFKNLFQNFFNKFFWIYCVLTITLFLAFSPSTIINFKEAILTIQNEFWRASTFVPKNHNYLLKWFGLLLRNIEMMGPCFALLAIISLLWNIIKPNKKFVLLLIPALVCWFALTDMMRARHLVLLLPFYALWFGRFFQSAYESRYTIIKYGVLFLFVLCSSYSFFYNAKTIWFRYHDNRYLASKYIQTNIPSGATLGIKCLEGDTKAYTHKHFHEFMWDFPYFPQDKYDLTDCTLLPEYLVLSEYSDKYPLTAIKSGFLENDIWPVYETGLWWKEVIPNPELIKLYRELLTNKSNDYKLIKEFDSPKSESITFKIYYDIMRFEKINWKLIAKYYFNPNNFMLLEYPSPNILIYKLRTD